MKKLELTEAEKAQAAKLAKTATAAPSDDFWKSVETEANRLTKVPKVEPRQARPDK